MGGFPFLARACPEVSTGPACPEVSTELVEVFTEGKGAWRLVETVIKRSPHYLLYLYLDEGELALVGIENIMLHARIPEIRDSNL